MHPASAKSILAGWVISTTRPPASMATGAPSAIVGHDGRSSYPSMSSADATSADSGDPVSDDAVSGSGGGAGW